MPGPLTNHANALRDFAEVGRDVPIAPLSAVAPNVVDEAYAPRESRVTCDSSPLSLGLRRRSLSGAAMIQDPVRMRDKLVSGAIPGEVRKMRSFEYILSTKRGGWGCSFSQGRDVAMSRRSQTKANPPTSVSDPSFRCVTVCKNRPGSVFSVAPYKRSPSKIVKIGELVDFRRFRPRCTRHLRQTKIDVRRFFADRLLITEY